MVVINLLINLSINGVVIVVWLATPFTWRKGLVTLALAAHSSGIHCIMSHMFQTIFIQILIIFIDTEHVVMLSGDEVLFDCLEDSAQKLVNRLSPLSSMSTSNTIRVIPDCNF